MEITNERIDLAIQLCREGKMFQLGDIILSGLEIPPNQIDVIFSTLWMPGDLTPARIDEAFTDAKRIFAELCSAYEQLASFATEKEVAYLIIRDYGKGGINICREKDGERTYYIDVE